MNIDEMYERYRAQQPERTPAFSVPAWRDGYAADKAAASAQPERYAERTDHVRQAERRASRYAQREAPRNADSDTAERLLLLLLAALLMNEKRDPLLIAALLYLAL